MQNGRVTQIGTGNSYIPPDGYVVSVHGTAKEAFKGLQVGDRAVLDQKLGDRASSKTAAFMSRQPRKSSRVTFVTDVHRAAPLP